MINMADSYMMFNPQSKLNYESVSKPPASSVDLLSLQQMIPTIRTILKKVPETRNNLENKVLVKFSKKSSFFSGIAEHTSPDVALNTLKYAQIHQISKNRTLISKGAEIENIMLMIKGKFGIIDLNDPPRYEIQRDQSSLFKRIIQNSLKIARDLKRKIKQYAQDNANVQFKTTKASMYDLPINKYNQDQELIFNLSAIVQGKKYSQSVISLKDCIILTVNAKYLYENIAAFVRKRKSDKISAFRKFSYFNPIDSERLIQLVDQLPLVTVKKGNYIYREGQRAKEIYLLVKGSIKLTKTVDLFKQNPNIFYLNREKVSESKLPFANFSELFNYKPRTKVVELGITNDLAIFGEQEFYSKDEIRQVNAQVSSETAVYYHIDLEKLENNLSDIKNFIEDLKQGLYNNQTLKKILYRQQKLSQILICETKNSMDYFFLEDTQNNVNIKHADVHRKFKINKVNSLISPKKSEKIGSITEAAFNTFNFNHFPLNSNKIDLSKGNRSLNQFTQNESKIFQLVHTLGTTRASATKLEVEQHKAKTYRKSFSKEKKVSIDIHNPLFEMAYFERNRKQHLRLQKQGRVKVLSNQKMAIKPSSSKTINRTLGTIGL